MKRNWEYKKLTDVCSIQYGYPFESGNFTNEANGMPLIRIRDVKDGQTETYYEGPYPAEYIVHKGEYLIGMDGEFNIAPWKSDDALLNQRVCKITAKEGVFVGFLYRFLIKELKRIEDETPFVTVKHLSAKRLNQVTLPVPPLDEQSRIVAELDLLTGIIDKQNAQLKELDNLAQAIFYDMFGDTIENPKGWEVRYLENIVESTCTLSYGIVQPGDDVINGVPVVRPVDLVETFVKVKGLKKTTEEISASYRRTVLTGYEILMCVRGTTGVVSLATAELTGCNVTRGIIPILPSAIIDRFFLYYVFRSSEMNALIQEHTYGATLKQINVKDVRNLPIILPPLALQQSFAEKIQSIEKQKETIRASIADTQKLLDYTMDKYFG